MKLESEIIFPCTFHSSCKVADCKMAQKIIEAVIRSKPSAQERSPTADSMSSRKLSEISINKRMTRN